MLSIEPEKEKAKITHFLKQVFEKQQINHAVIGLSGGIDSTVSLYLLKEVLSPEHIFAAHLYYASPVFTHIEKVLQQINFPKQNILHISIKQAVDEAASLLGIKGNQADKIRKGNIAARMRMIVLFDLAKKHNALVCGTENKSENLLGYYTRFGDQASDIEPVEHLYKTQIFQLATYLGVPQDIINQNPTAGLWHGQTDEGEFGFTYNEADQVLYLHLEKKLPLSELEKRGLSNAREILKRRQRNLFKQQTPYHL